MTVGSEFGAATHLEKGVKGLARIAWLLLKSWCNTHRIRNERLANGNCYTQQGNGQRNVIRKQKLFIYQGQRNQDQENGTGKESNIPERGV